VSGPDDIPLRPRARTFTPARVVLGSVLLLALGFIGGVEVQKRSGSGSGTAAPSRFAGRFTGSATGAARGGGAADPGATIGQVANVRGKTLYVTASDGTTKKVKTNANTKVTRSAVSHVRSIHPGDTVIVQGASASNGTVKASRVTATASNAAGAGFGGGGFGGFGGAGG
jgi:hypothetical protein